MPPRSSAAQGGNSHGCKEGFYFCGIQITQFVLINQIQVPGAVLSNRIASNWLPHLAMAESDLMLYIEMLWIPFAAWTWAIETFSKSLIHSADRLRAGLSERSEIRVSKLLFFMFFVILLLDALLIFYGAILNRDRRVKVFRCKYTLIDLELSSRSRTLGKDTVNWHQLFLAHKETRS